MATYDPSQLMQLAQSLARSAPVQAAPPPDYTGDINGINRDYALADALAQQQYIPNSGWLGALAQAVSGGLSYYKGKKADKAASEVGSKLRAEEQAQKQAEAERLAQERASNIERLASAYGINPEQAAVVADGLGKAADFKPPEAEKPKVFKVGNQLVQVGPEGQPKVLHSAPASVARTARPMADFEAYMAMTPEDRAAYDQFKGRNQGGQGAPSGYRFTAQGGLEPIPGGPADPALKPVPGEQAARVALTEEYLANSPAISEQIDAGNLTGPIDQLSARVGYGKAGEAYRQLESGIDALRRGLTGAGMSGSETEEYTRRYKPAPTDTAATLKSKKEQLDRELRRFAVNAGRPGQIIPNSSISQQGGDEALIAKYLQ